MKQVCVYPINNYYNVLVLTLDDTVLDVSFAVGHVHRDRLDVRHVLELDTAYRRTYTRARAA